MSKEFLLLNNLDEPMKLGVFQMHDVGAVFAIILSCSVFNAFTTMLISLVLYVFFFRKYLANFSRGSLREVVYFHFGLGEGTLVYKCPSYQRRMIG